MLVKTFLEFPLNYIFVAYRLIISDNPLCINLLSVGFKFVDF